MEELQSTLVQLLHVNAHKKHSCLAGWTRVLLKQCCLLLTSQRHAVIGAGPLKAALPQAALDLLAPALAGNLGHTLAETALGLAVYSLDPAEAEPEMPLALHGTALGHDPYL